MSISQNFPNTRPSLSINFARSQILDPRITFTRTTSGTRVGPDGYIEVIPADQPRFDFDPVTGECLGLLIEESRTNLIRYSIISNVVGWSISGSTVTNNATTAPDGTNTAARIQVDPGGYVADLSISVTAGQTYTFSFWVKSVSGSGTWGINIYDHGGANIGHHRTTVNITEEWQRVSYTYTPTGTAVNVYVSDDREGLATISDAYVWGAQLEQGSFKTSLIPTEGSTKTRNADNASITGSNFTEWYNPSEGTVYADTRMVGVQTGRYDRLWAITNSNLNFEGISIFLGGPGFTPLGNYVASMTVTNSATEQVGALAYGNQSATNVPRAKYAFAFKENDANSSFNGEVFTTDTSVALSSFTTPPDRLLIGQPQRFQGHSCMTISQLTYYPTRLSNQALQNLTK